ncbi:MAG: CopG family transcriptional regulator [Clostridia bacterium]|nr:CopG family transcriptional regulator [Clostridia bacterium]
MQDSKLIITPKRYKDETQVISVRMPKDMLHDIDAVAQNTGRTRNEIILLGMTFTLQNLEIAGEE